MQAAREPPFILGLTMAGAISAGAYSAGVFDFLIQALEEWEKAKAADDKAPEHERRVPSHRLIIPVISGASAGGITAALGILAVGAGDRLAKVEAAHRRCVLPALYEAWVNRISFTPRNGSPMFLLGVSDLQREGLVSLLDSTIIQSAADELLHAARNFRGARPYLARHLHLFLTVTNLRGIPYRIAFAGSDGHVMTMHGDRIHYRFEGFGKRRFESKWLESYFDVGLKITPQSLSDPQFLEEYREAAIATGAFPIGLPARLIERQTSEYKFRAWTFRRRREQLDNIEPLWPPRAPDGTTEYPFSYAASDGGLIDNEPFELARWTIMKTPGVPNETSAEKANRAVLMIDPFPTPSAFDPDLSAEELKKQLWLRAVISNLFPALKNQARIKAIDLARASREGVYSRFLISPSRQIKTKRNGKEVEEDAYERLASGVLGAFGGFLCLEFPEHDYQLGRRNCQWFLRQHLVLDANNQVFKNWPEKAVHNPSFHVERDRKKFRTVIPLLGSAEPEVNPLPWPRIGNDVIDRFIEHVRLRGNELVAKIIREELKQSNCPWRFFVCCGWLLVRKNIFEWVRLRLVADLIRRDQHKDWTALRDDKDRLIIAALFDPSLRGARVLTAEDIARDIKRRSLGRVTVKADQVRKRLHGHLAKHVKPSREGDKEVFQLCKKPGGRTAWFTSFRNWRKTARQGPTRGR